MFCCYLFAKNAKIILLLYESKLAYGTWHIFDVIQNLDLLLNNVGGTTKININKIATSNVDKLAYVSHEIIVFSTLKGKRVYAKNVIFKTKEDARLCLSNKRSTLLAYGQPKSVKTKSFPSSIKPR